MCERFCPRRAAIRIRPRCLGEGGFEVFLRVSVRGSGACGGQSKAARSAAVHKDVDNPFGVRRSAALWMMCERFFPGRLDIRIRPGCLGEGRFEVSADASAWLWGGWWSVQSGAQRRSPYARGQPLWSTPLGGALDDVRTVFPGQIGYSDQTTGSNSSIILIRSNLKLYIVFIIAGEAFCSNQAAEHHGYRFATVTSPCLTAF